MTKSYRRAWQVGLLIVGSPLVTIATCNQNGPGGQFFLTSTNDDFFEDVEDALDELFEGDHDDDD